MPRPPSRSPNAPSHSEPVPTTSAFAGWAPATTPTARGCWTASISTCRPDGASASWGPAARASPRSPAVLLRLVPYQSGSASVDGIELRALAGDDVRRVVGLAAQDSHLFDTTMRENLLLARRDADEPAIRAALAHARLLPWVEQLPRQLDTEVGEHGTRLSGGQRQRLAVARMYLADFPVAILDEPGEHLDTASADALTADLVHLARGRTTVLISHRLAGMEDMDEVLVLDAGRVVERGNHAELLSAGGAYAEQWQRERRVDDEMAEMGARW